MATQHNLEVLVAGWGNFFAIEVSSAQTNHRWFEYFQTLPLEVELIWPDQWNLMKILFILNRYGSLVATLFAYTLEAATKSTSFRLCRAGVISQGSQCASKTEILQLTAFKLVVIGLNLSWSETLLFMRVYALSGSNRYVGAFLCTLWTGIFCGITINFYYTTKVVEFLEFPWPGQACLAKPIANTLRLGFPFFVILAEQAVVMVLCIYYGLNKHWSSRSRLARTFSRDGTYYFIAISIMSVANVTFNLAFPGKFQHYFGPFVAL
ncbi:hypothetical protein BKA70DRAFT_1440126 [Coprinopsis sp. MPI-PUGE-AT-0042]|nr:hypothetical protein BKA70DRAFT_1440126 [Coprinopsis sp. MPI-PUGE-AT-0042]